MKARVEEVTSRDFGERVYTGTLEMNRRFRAQAIPPFDYVYVWVTCDNRRDQTERNATPGEKHAVVRALLQYELQQTIAERRPM